MPQSNMDVQSIKDFCKARGFVEVNKTVRENSNGFPFITFIDTKNVAENIYFSRNMATQVAEGVVITAELFSKLRVATTVNSNGETRLKLCGSGESQRVSIDELL